MTSTSDNETSEDNETPSKYYITWCSEVDNGILQEHFATFFKNQTQMNTPARRRSVFANMKPVNVEMLKLVSVLIAMWLNKRPTIKGNW